MVQPGEQLPELGRSAGSNADSPCIEIEGKSAVESAEEGCHPIARSCAPEEEEGKEAQEGWEAALLRMHGDSAVVHEGPAQEHEHESAAEACMQPYASHASSPASKKASPAASEQQERSVEIPDPPSKGMDQPSSSGGAAASGEQTPSSMLLGLLPGSGHPSASPGGTAAATPAAAAARSSSTDCPKICRFCHEEDSDEPGDRLIAPCLCMGTVKYVHVECLNKWRSTAVSRSAKCGSCNFEFRFSVVDKLWKRLLRFKAFVPLLTMLACAGLIVGLGWIPWMGDPSNWAWHILNGEMVLGCFGLMVAGMEMLSFKSAMEAMMQVHPRLGPGWRTMRLIAWYLWRCYILACAALIIVLDAYPWFFKMVVAMVGVVWIHVVTARLAWGALSEPKKEIQSLGDSERLDILRLQRQAAEERERLQREEERARRQREEEEEGEGHEGGGAAAATAAAAAGRREDEERDEDEEGEDRPLLMADRAERGAASMEAQQHSSAGPAHSSSSPTARSAEVSPRAGGQGGGDLGRRRLPGEVEEGGAEEGQPLLEPDPERGEAGGGPAGAPKL